ncbi:ABC transporter permease subunit [Chelatococcus sp. SYSU_G07232]|uniref:ABC transporter permease subunit n=1 Tax=Chelatococcus albus TaxID=3047466 RepID=A0ABT7AJU4_9HYPH|nr:ABC transporter permease subunit [Chelatococcus sp. SYSU_G07232]MDJ1159638.1 ABC transporter permease subunit [Chelatococcus sp. SYSU_G07232]
MVPGLLALALVLGVVAAALAGLALAAGPSLPVVPWGYVGGVVAFSLWQALVSTILSLALGAGLALALARRTRFAGRTLLIAAMNLATVLPAIVVVFGVVTVFGRAGWLGEGMRALGFDMGSWLYGLPGILIAHVFFNAPLAARVFLAGLAAVPAEHWRLAAQLGMGPLAVFRFIDRPVLLREAPGLAGLVFLLCFTSFAVVLALGGGPRAATLEVSIYEALRFDVDFGRAGVLAALQIVLGLVLVLPILRLGTRAAEAAATGFVEARPDVEAVLPKVLDALVLALGTGLVLPPLAAVALSGARALATLAQPEVLASLATSVVVAIPAGALSVALALAFAGLTRRLRIARARPRAADAVSLAGLVILVMPPFTLAAGLFVVLRLVADPFALGLPLLALVNALMALPLVLRQVEPPLMLSAERYGHLAESLGIVGTDRLRLVDAPLLRRPVIVAFAAATALSLGDLGVAAFFGSGEFVTLPVLLHQRLGAYRMDEAASVALLLALLAFAFFILAQHFSGDGRAGDR